ncbi:MAG: sigma-70 family RNA polymerase sigma factor, partial [Deltaproteobacteria bacterium]
PFDLTARRQMQGRLASCVAELTQRQQQVLHLYYVEELNLREIGAVLEVTESRICQIMSAATLQLRVLLKERTYNG